MTVTAIHQFVAALVPRDAVSLHTLEAQRVIREMGFESEIFVEHSVGEMRARSHFYREFDTRTGSQLILYQASTGCALGGFVAGSSSPVVVNYHNVTPPGFYEPWDAEAVVSLTVGRRQLAELGARGAPALADSAFNAADLAEMGFERVAVAPVLLDPASRHPDADAAAVRSLRARAGHAPRILFVGRVAPNKAQHDLVKALAVHRAVFDTAAHLTLVGGTASPGYAAALRRLIDGAGLAAAVDWLPEVSDRELADLYGAADAFVCLSEHEGFCVPVLEAMHHRLPVIAYAAGAVPETVGAAALLLTEKDPNTVAHAIQRVLDDDGLRHGLLVAGAARVRDFALEPARERFRRELRALLPSARAA